MTRVFLTVVLAFACASHARAQSSDPLHDARALYEAAAYEDALAELAKVPPDASTAPVEQYRAFCLIALGRMNEASTAVTRAVTADPLLMPSASDASPRVRALFADARRKVLPDITRDAYVQAKAAYSAKDFTAAASGFERVIALADAAEAGEELADLRLLAQEFLDLSTRPGVGAPSPVALLGTGNTSRTDARKATAPTTGAVRTGPTRGPITIVQRMPAWTRQAGPANPEGRLHINIDAQGRVTSAIMTQSTDPLYDLQVLEAAKQWKYEPALSNGRPIASEKDIRFVLKR